jgi:MFS transporter, DHA1 family, tetracycline resistance protein
MNNKLLSSTYLGAILLDAACEALPVTVLAVILAHPDSPTLMRDSPVEVRQALYGVLLGIYPAAMFLLSPLIGSISDRGRRKGMLLICLIALALAQFSAALGIATEIVLLLSLGRLAGGMAASSESVAQAALLDISTTEEERRRVLAWGMFMGSGGYVAGSMFAAVTMDGMISDWFSPATPFALTGIFGLILAFLVLIYGRRNRPPAHAHRLPPPGIGTLFRDLRKALRDPRFRFVAVIVFLAEVASTLFTAFSPIFLMEAHGGSGQDTGWFLAVLGLTASITYVGLLPRALAEFGTVATLRLGLVLAALGAFGVTLSTDDSQVWFLATPTMIGISLAYGALMQVFSDLGGERHQGFIFGEMDSIMALGVMFGSLGGGVIEAFTTRGAMAIMALLSVAVALLAFLPETRRLEPTAAGA